MLRFVIHIPGTSPGMTTCGRREPKQAINARNPRRCALCMRVWRKFLREARAATLRQRRIHEHEIMRGR